MYHSIKISVKEGELYNYFDNLCKNYNNMINVVHYHIRQCMSGLKKSEDERFPNETEVINGVAKTLEAMNAPKLTKDGVPKKKAERKPKKVSVKKSQSTKKKAKKEGFTMPTAEEWFLGYNFLDAYFKKTKNADYYALPAHVNQDAIKDAIESWSSYFASLESFKANPSAFRGMPNPPYYRESGGYATATLSNQICKVKKKDDSYYLIFPKTKLALNIGKIELAKCKLMETKIKPSYGYFEVVMTFDDGVETPPVSEKSKRVIGLDLGVANVATISNNIGLKPVIIKGGVIKSYNQWVNKKSAEIQSLIDTNSDEKWNGLTPFEQKPKLWGYRGYFLNDTFSKISKYIVDYAEDNRCDTIVIGKSNHWKTDSKIGRVNNQSFCFIPHNKLITDIQYRAERAGIRVIINEESYTSQASFLDNDNIPVYGEVKGKQKFSGDRVHRGLYRSPNGTFLNADVNGASNIIRKALPEAFKGITDFSYLWTSVETKNFRDFVKLPKSKYSA